MNWVLILITWSTAITTASFDTQATCEAAKAKMLEQRQVKVAECFKK